MHAVFSLDIIANEFYTAALNYSNIIRPYALKLFFALLLIELLVTFIQYTADGALDPHIVLRSDDPPAHGRRLHSRNAHLRLSVDDARY